MLKNIFHTYWIKPYSHSEYGEYFAQPYSEAKCIDCVPAKPSAKPKYSQNTKNKSIQLLVILACLLSTNKLLTTDQDPKQTYIAKMFSAIDHSLTDPSYKLPTNNPWAMYTDEPTIYAIKRNALSALKQILTNPSPTVNSSDKALAYALVLVNVDATRLLLKARTCYLRDCAPFFLPEINHKIRTDFKNALAAAQYITQIVKPERKTAAEEITQLIAKHTSVTEHAPIYDLPEELFALPRIQLRK